MNKDKVTRIESKIDINKDQITWLRDVYRKSSQEEKAIFQAFVLYDQKSDETDTRDFIKGSSGLYYHVLVSVLKKLCTRHCEAKNKGKKTIAGPGVGEFIVGRKTKKSRFISTYSLKSIGEVAIGKKEELEKYIPLSIANFDQTENLVEYNFPLTHERNLLIKLPKDLTSDQAERLSQFIKAMALPSKN